MNIGDRLKQLRKELDLTQEAFASRIGSVQNTITGYESGRRNPSAPVISLICREFNVNEEWLRNGTGEMFIPKSNDELDALAKRYNFTYKDYVLMEKLCKDREARAALIDVALKISADLLKSGIDPESSAFGASQRSANYSDIPDTPEELERKFPTLEDQEKKEGGLG